MGAGDDLKNSSPVKLVILLLIASSLLPVLVFIHLSTIKPAAVIILSLVFLLSLRKTVYGFYALAFSMPFMFLPSVFGRNIALPEALVFVVLIVFCIRNFGGRELRLVKTKLDTAVLVFTVVSVFALLWNWCVLGFPLQLADAGVGSPAFNLRLLLASIEFALIYFLGVNVVKKGDVNKILILLVSAAFIASIYGITQFYFSGVERPHSFFHHPNLFAMFLVMVLPVSITRFMHSRRKLVWWLPPAVLFIALVLTNSRGGMMAFTASTAFMMFFAGADRKTRLGLAVVVLTLALTVAWLFNVFVETNYGKYFFEREFHASSHEWSRYRLPASGKYILMMTVDSGEMVTVPAGGVYVANLTPTSSAPKIITDGEVVECGSHCFLRAGSRLEAWVNDSFSFSVKADSGGSQKLRLILENRSFVHEGGVLSPTSLRILHERRRRIMDLGYRRVAWGEALGVALKNPVSGNGFVSFTVDGTVVEHSHNLYLQLWLERGVFCLLTFLWILRLFFRGLGKYSGCSLAMAAGILAYLVHGMVDYNINIGLLFFLYLALVAIREQ